MVISRQMGKAPVGQQLKQRLAGLESILVNSETLDFCIECRIWDAKHGGGA